MEERSSAAIFSASESPFSMASFWVSFCSSFKVSFCASSWLPFWSDSPFPAVLCSFGFLRLSSRPMPVSSPGSSSGRIDPASSRTDFLPPATAPAAASRMAARTARTRSRTRRLFSSCASACSSPWNAFSSVLSVPHPFLLSQLLCLNQRMLSVNFKKVGVFCMGFPAKSQSFPVLHRIVQGNPLLESAVNILKGLLLLAS